MNAITSGIRIAATVSLALLMNTAMGQAQSSGTTPSTARDGSAAGTNSMRNPAGSDANSMASPAGSDESAKAAGTTAAKPVSAADKKMMKELAQANVAEIETAKLAQSQTKNPEVQAFAKKMIDDHTQAGNELMQLAQSKGVTLPDKPDSKHQAMAKKLSKLSDQQFDKQYMANAGVSDHRSAVALLKRINTRATDPDLKALAGKLLPTVEQHLSLAQQKKQQ